LQQSDTVPSAEPDCSSSHIHILCCWGPVLFYAHLHLTAVFFISFSIWNFVCISYFCHACLCL